MPTTFLWFLFDWRGRLGRGPYRAALLGLLLADRMRDILPEGAGPSRAATAMLVVNFIISMSLDAKRLHDLGRSSAWILGTNFVGVCIAAFMFRGGAFDPETIADVTKELGGDSMLIGQAGPIGAFGLALGAIMRGVCLSAFKGDPAPNQYDFDPRASIGLVAEKDPEQREASVDALIALALAERERAAREKNAPVTAGIAQRPKTFGKRGRAA